MIVRITRVKVGHRQASLFKQKASPQGRLFVFYTFLFDSLSFLYNLNNIYPPFYIHQTFPSRATITFRITRVFSAFNLENLNEISSQ